MKVISWNCNMKFREKYKFLLKYDADIMVIQECENPNEIKYPSEFINKFSSYLWTGDNKNKGLGVFSKIKIYDNNWNVNDSKYFISCKIDDDLNILAVWCKKHEIARLNYIGQLYKYLEYNIKYIEKEPVIIIGDLNSYKGFDSGKKPYHHTNVIKKLEDIGITSMYHKYFNEKDGEENKKTHFNRKNKNNGYHIDYVLAKDNSYSEINNIVVGDYEDWIKISDHMPIFIKFERAK